MNIETASKGNVGREQLLLDGQWRFHLGDIPMPVVRGHDESYMNAKAGRALGAAAPEYDDTVWPVVDLPHDWALETPFDANNNVAQGFHSRGFGWYRRAFRLAKADAGRHLELQFDGIATHCTVWVNGVIAARNFCGYTSFAIDITPFARFGDDLNTIAVRVDADAQEGWWYEGAGIYRHVWLVKRSPVHIATDGVWADPVHNGSDHWTVPVEVTLGSAAVGPETVRVTTELIAPDGAIVTKSQGEASIDPFDTVVALLSLPIQAPSRWSCESPALYSLRTTISQDGEELDSVATTIGFRTIRFDPETGFYLNDVSTKFLGTCNHQDHAGVGVAVPDSLWEFRLRRLKEMGSNAYRCAHNPPSKEFLDAADRIGIIVMDENRIFNTTDEYVRQLQWLIRRDRNHPSVIMWSIFNEEPFQGTEQGYEMVRRMSAVVKRLDTARPVMAAQSGGNLNDVNASQAADLAGFNYQQQEYDRYHAAYPDKMLLSSEDTSAVMTRGEYATDRQTRFVLASYDDEFQPWGATHRKGWREVATRPFVAGTFVWTGFDYRGEPQPLEWPATGSSFGIMDQCGFPKAAYYIHQAQWITSRPILHLVPHWNWSGREGEPIRVMAIANADEVEIRLNGRVIGRKPIDPIDVTATWDVPYEPGVLEAIGYKNSDEIVRFTIETTGAPHALRLSADRESIANDGCDAMPVTVEVVDAQGRVVPTAGPSAVFTVSPSGQIIGVGNGDPICHEPDKAEQRSLYNGLAQIIVQSTAGATEPMTLTASADGLQPATITVGLDSVPAIPSVPAERSVMLISQWRQSPATDERPDPSQSTGKTDMNTYSTISPGRPQALAGGRYAVLRASFMPRASVQRDGGRLVFNALIGKADIYVDGIAVASKDDPEPMTVEVLVPTTGDHEHTVVVIVEAGDGEVVGLGGVVMVEANAS